MDQFPPGPADEDKTANILMHLLADVHDISERLSGIESLVSDLAPVARQYAGMARMRSLGRLAVNSAK